MLDDETERKEDDEEELEKDGSDLDFVRDRLNDESGGVEAYSQALETVQDPQLKEILQAIHEDEQKHQAALEQWMSEHGEGEGEGEGDEEPDPGEEDPGITEEDTPPDDAPEGLDAGPDEPEEDEEKLDKEDETTSLIDDIREVLVEHEGGEEELDIGKEDEIETADDGDEEDEDDGLEKECGKIHKAYRVPIIKADQRIVYGVVSEPGSIDLQGDRLSEPEIRRACHKFMQDSQKIGKEHEGVAKASIIESYIAPVAFKCNGQPVRKGSWVMAVKIHDDKLWNDVKKGEITGFSIAGTGTRTPF